MKAKKKSPRKRAPKSKPVSTAVVVSQSQPEHKPVISQTELSLSNPAQIMEFGQVLKVYIEKNGLSVKIEDKQYPLCGAWKFAGMNFGLTAVPVELTPKHKDGQYITIMYAMRTFEGKRKDGTLYKFDKEVPVFSGFANDDDIIEKVRSRNKITREVTRPYYAYSCTVEVRRSDDKVVNIGKSVCSNLESLKSGFDEYAVMGQAQTRTISRALRNLLDFVLNAAGMESTPGEEITQEMVDESGRQQQPPPPTSEAKKQKPTDAAFEKLVSRAKAGEKVKDKAVENLDLTTDQIEALRVVEEEFEKSKT